MLGEGEEELRFFWLLPHPPSSGEGRRRSGGERFIPRLHNPPPMVKRSTRLGRYTIHD